MPGASLDKDLAELLEFWGADVTANTDARVLACYLLACFTAWCEGVHKRDEAKR